MKKLTKIFFSSALVLSSLVAIYAVTDKETVNAESNSLNLVYQLNFEDETNLGKNSVDNDYADATVYRTGDHMVQVDRDGGKAIMMDGATRFENYLNLPTNFFEGQTEATISGWFYLDSTAQPYSGEIGIYSPENDKAFRTDSHANYHGGHYIFVLGNDQWFDSGIFPVYDGWYHMAYVFSGNRLEVYQNGHLVGSRNGNQFASVSQLHSATSHFYLGQSAYEKNHPDYKGGFDDIRIYQKALTAAEISSEYDFDMFDFMTNEYTFDSEETMYNDSVRGYDLDPHGADDKPFGPTSWPTFDDGAMKLDGNSMVVVSRNGNHDQTSQPTKVNATYLFGMSEVSISMDVKVDSNTGFNWERLFDIYKSPHPEGRIISFLTHQGSSNSSFDVVYKNKKGDNIRWVLGENGKQVNLAPGNWYNITISSAVNELNIFVDGIKIASINDIYSIGQMATYNYISGMSPDAWFTLGAPIYESDRMLAASYDNFRVFSKALNETEVQTLSANYSRVTSKNVETLNKLIGKYVDSSAMYTKQTQIFLNDEAIDELLKYGGFHAGVSILERTTYYKGSELWMSREDGKYSYYGTAEGNTGVTYALVDTPLVTPLNANVVLSGEGKNSMQEYYVGLEDIIAKNEHNWTVENGVYTSKNDEVIEWFKAFTAPCYLGFTTEETTNYISLNKVTISVDSNNNLILRL